MSLQDSEVINKIFASAISGKTPELLFFSKWLEKKKVNEEKYKKDNINDYVFSLQILNSSYGKYDINNENIIKLKSEMESWLRNDYGYQFQKETPVTPQTDNTKWSKAKFDGKIMSLTENITKLRNNYISNNDLDEDYAKNCDDLIKEILSFIDNSEVCHESSCFISSNDANKKKLCPNAILKDCINNYKGIKLLSYSDELIKSSDSLDDINEAIKQINEFTQEFGKIFKGKGYSIVTQKVKLMVKKCKILFNKFVEEFRKTKYLDFNSLIKSGAEYLKEIKIIKDELNQEEEDYSADRFTCEDKYKYLEKAIKYLKQDNSELVTGYKENINEIINLLKLNPVGDSLDEAIEKASELVVYWKNFWAQLDPSLKICREYEKEVLKKLKDLKKDSEEYEGNPEGYSKDLEIFEQTITVQVYPSENNNIVSSFFDNIKKWLHLG